MGTFDFRSLVEDFQTFYQVPGVAIAVTDRDGLLAECYSGWAERGLRPVTAETLFQAGSIGKAMTALLVLQEQAKGRLDLEAPVQQYLPWCELPTVAGAVTIHHLLSHTAGLPTLVDFGPNALADVHVLAKLGPYRPGARFHYSNPGYKLLGLVLEAVTGQPYPALLAERVLVPLGMDASLPEITANSREREAVGYMPLHDDCPPHPGQPLAPALWWPNRWADGSVVSNAADLARFARLLLNRGRGPQDVLLPEHAFEAWIAPRLPRAKDVMYGYGLQTLSIDGHRLVGHGGTMPGLVASMQVDLEAGIGVVAFANTLCGIGQLTRAAWSLFRADGSLSEAPHWTAPSNEVAPPEDGTPLCGLYRSFTPFLANFRIAGNADALRLVYPWGEAHPLVPVGDMAFALDDEHGPERLRLEDFRDGTPLRAVLSGVPYFRPLVT